MSDKIYRPLVLFLLVVLIIAISANTILPILRENERRAQEDERRAGCQAALEAANLTGMATNYENDIYNNSSVDNIYKQTFMSSQYQFQIQVIIAGLIAACAP
jgi:type II secretory pathway pseudopilin PulG